MEVTQKMQLFKTHQGESRSGWYKLMADVLNNFSSMYWTGNNAIIKVDRLHKSGFERLDNYSRLFLRCMLKWCVEEDGTINKEFVEILTDLETHMADAVRFILQHVDNGAANFDGKDFSNIDHLLPRMGQACLHVLSADSSPPNFNNSYGSLDLYGAYLEYGSRECQGSIRRKISSQITKVRSFTKFVSSSTNKINHENEQELSICLESLYDKVGCHVFCGCWESNYNMYLSGPNINIDALFLAGIRKVTTLHLDVCPVETWTDETLEAYIGYAQESLKQLQIDINYARPVTDQLENLHRKLGIIVKVLTSSPLQLQGPNLVDLRVEIQVLAGSMESLSSSYFTTQTEDVNVVVASAAENVSCGLQNLLSSIIKYRVMQSTICMPVPLTREFFIDLMGRVQRFTSQMIEDENIIRINPVKDQLENLHHHLRSFVAYHVDYAETKGGIEVMDSTAEIQNISRNIEYFIYSFFAQTKDIEPVICAAVAKMIYGLRNFLALYLKPWVLQLTNCATLPLTNEVLLQFMECVQRLLSLLSKDMSCPLRIQIEFLHNEMGNLVHFHVDYLPVAVRMEVQTIVMNTASFVYSTLISQVKQEEAKVTFVVHNLLTSILTAWVFNINAKEYLGSTMIFPLSDVVEKFARLKVNVVDIIFLVIVFRLRRITPLTDQLGFLEFFLVNAKESVCGGQYLGKFKKFHEALLLLRDFLQSMTNYSITYSHDTCERIANVAYEAECLMYSHDDGSYSASCRNLWVYHLAQHVELTKTSTLDILEKKENVGEISGGSTRDQNHVVPQALIQTADFVVGFEDEMRLIKQRLTFSNKKQLDVVSVIGMPGLGKTTLARKVYEDRQIVDHFRIRAWCVISNEFNKKDLLLTLLGFIIELTDEIQKMSEVNLSTLLHKQLMGRRYLVVMDDIWKIEAFEFLKVYLPENNNGSRILLTSRYRVIGMKAKHHSDLLELRMLTDDESWLLLSKKVYRDQGCPVELSQVGKRIAESCKGLPLAVVVVAGLLAKSSKTREFWEQVAENLSSYISHDSQVQGMDVLELSYKYLPRHLKPLFLYIGAFPEDREVSAENLIRLWLAEGFVKDNLIGSLEHQAEMYLLDLIDRSFIMVAARRSDGRVKTCIVHDLLRDMSLHKAKEEHLLQQINVSDDLPHPVSYQRRLSIFLQRRKEVTPTHLISGGASTRPFIVHEGLSTPSMATPLYSLLFFNKNRSLPLWKEAVASVVFDLKLLRILHFESTSIDANLCGGVMMLVHLRYISIRAVWKSIPSLISKLQNLETLIIKGLRGEINVSEEIWELVKLRHLHVNDRAKFCYPRSKSSMLENLETLSTPTIRRGDEEKLMRRVPKVRKLRCIFLDSCPRLISRNQLESFKAIHTGIGRCPGSFVVPSTLKKLSLSNFRLKWEQVSMFQELPELEIMNLRIGAVDCDSWNMDEEEEFLKLKVLKLESLNIKRWTACAYNFPCLEKLVLKKCKQLMEIPGELGEINSLQKIEVLWCSKSSAISAGGIEEDQKEAGNELLEVHIYPPVNLHKIEKIPSGSSSINISFIPSAEEILGKAKVFQARRMEKKVQDAAIMIQRQIRTYIARKEFILMRRAAINMQTQIRKDIAQKEFISMRNAAI